MTGLSTAANIQKHFWSYQTPTLSSRIAPSCVGVGTLAPFPEQLDREAIPWIRILRQPTVFCGIEIPNALSHLLPVIEQSRWMLDLADDWDDAGSPAYETATWETAISFFLKSSVELWQNTSRRISAPKIHNGPEGSIDILWKTERFSLLINIPPKGERASYYGSKSNEGTNIKGTLDSQQSAAWLMQWTTE